MLFARRQNASVSMVYQAAWALSASMQCSHLHFSLQIVVMWLEKQWFRQKQLTIESWVVWNITFLFLETILLHDLNMNPEECSFIKIIVWGV